MSSAPVRRPRMAVVMTIPLCVKAFMGPHLPRLAERFDITLITHAREEELSALLTSRVRFQFLAIRREISPIADFVTLLKLWSLARRERFDVVHSMTPKAGLLGMVAAALAGVPTRVHTFTGQVWATRTGLARAVLKTMDRVIARFATHLFADSPSQRAFLIEERVAAADRLRVIGAGSVCGVNTERFRPDALTRARVRTQLGIPDSALVALYLGRLNAAKGVRELAQAFLIAAREKAGLHLVMVGPDEGSVREELVKQLQPIRDRVRFVGATDEPDIYMKSADFFVLPSHREGFGSTVIEAAACAVPSIGTRIYGLTDAIVEDQTGILIAVQDVPALAAAMVRMANDDALRTRLGKAAFERVQADFSQERFTDALRAFYDERLQRTDVLATH